MRVFRSCVAAAALPLAMLAACDDASVTEPREEVVPIGALLPLSGGLEPAGRASRAALQVARDEVNAYLREIGSTLRFELTVEDDESSPTVARQKIEALRGRGVRLVIGPQTSGGVAAVSEFVHANGMLLISQSSSAIELAVAGDNIFRFSPDDRREAEAMATLVHRDGVRTLVPIWRDDPYGRGLTRAVKTRLEALGGSVDEGVAYGTAAPSYASAVDALRSRVEAAVARESTASVGVYVVSFDELLEILALARQSPALSSVRWYAGNVTPLLGPILDEPAARQFASSTAFTAATYVGDPDATEHAARVAARIAAETGQQPDSYAVVAYDAFWVAALAYLSAGAGSAPEVLRTALVRTAQQHFGATGWMALNEAGDRRFGSYDFFGICRGTDRWSVTARYRAAPGGIGSIEHLSCP